MPCLLTLVLLSQLRDFSSQEIVVKENEPIIFSLSIKDKEGWEKTDKIQTLDSTKEVSPELKFVTRGDEYFCWAPPGEYFFRGSSLKINWTKQDFDKTGYEVRIRVGKVVPPAPPVPPTPPGPANPFPSDGKFCLFIEEQAERANLPNSQQQIFSSSEIFSRLDDKGFAWRILDQNDEFAPTSVWKKPTEGSAELGAFRIIISNGKTWKQIKLPNTITDVLTLIKEFE